MLADCLSIHSLTRKTSHCQGTGRNEGRRDNGGRKSIKLASSNPLNSRSGSRRNLRDSFWGEASGTPSRWRKTSPGHPSDLTRNVPVSLNQGVGEPSFQQELLLKNETKFSRAANLHVTNPAVACYLFTPPPPTRSHPLPCCPIPTHTHPPNGTLQRGADREDAVKITVIMTLANASPYLGDSGPVWSLAPFHSHLIRQTCGSRKAF